MEQEFVDITFRLLDLNKEKRDALERSNDYDSENNSILAAYALDDFHRADGRRSLLTDRAKEIIDIIGDERARQLHKNALDLYRTRKVELSPPVSYDTFEETCDWCDDAFERRPRRKIKLLEGHDTHYGIHHTICSDCSSLIIEDIKLIETSTELTDKFQQIEKWNDRVTTLRQNRKDEPQTDEETQLVCSIVNGMNSLIINVVAKRKKNNCNIM